MKAKGFDVKIVFNAVYTRCQFLSPDGISNQYRIEYTNIYPYIGYIVARSARTKKPAPLIVRVAGQEKDLRILCQCN